MGNYQSREGGTRRAYLRSRSEETGHDDLSRDSARSRKLNFVFFFFTDKPYHTTQLSPGARTSRLARLAVFPSSTFTRFAKFEFNFFLITLTALDLISTTSYLRTEITNETS